MLILYHLFNWLNNYYAVEIDAEFVEAAEDIIKTVLNPNKKLKFDGKRETGEDWLFQAEVQYCCYFCVPYKLQ